MAEAQPTSRIATVHAAELERFRTMWHREVGVIAALDYCAEHGVTAPPWLPVEAAHLIATVLDPNRAGRSPSGRRGRNANPLRRYRQDLIDFARYDAVRRMRELQIEATTQSADLAELQRPPASLKDFLANKRHWLGRTFLEAIQRAADDLLGSPAYGSPDAVKRSHDAVARNLKDAAQKNRYLVLPMRTLRRLGLVDIVDPKPRQPMRPFYEDAP